MSLLVADLDRCNNENPYVEVHAIRVYDSDGEYIENDQVVAVFSLIEFDNHLMASMIKTKKADEFIKNQSGNIIIKGKLDDFSHGSQSRMYQTIKNNYVEYYQGELTEEEVLNIFTPIQFSQYKASKGEFYVSLIILIFLIIFGIIKYS